MTGQAAMLSGPGGAVTPAAVEFRRHLEIDAMLFCARPSSSVTHKHSPTRPILLQPAPFMDIFGTVVGAIDLAGKLIEYVKAIKGSKQDRLDLLSELSTLKALLEIMSGRLDDSDADGSGDDISNKLVKAGIKCPLHACYRSLQSTVDDLDHVVQKSTGTSPFVGIIKDLAWPFRREEIRTTLGHIEHLKSLISLALQTSLV
ncbi:hypothetical protein BD779DRAFT_1476331 [Infundibulicybe gibba]|nr:hypothetical protein BD779DRAFT_1476331 [Infundibulicybe gibba]